MSGTPSRYRIAERQARVDRLVSQITRRRSEDGKPAGECESRSGMWRLARDFDPDSGLCYYCDQPPCGAPMSDRRCERAAGHDGLCGFRRLA